MIVSDQYDKGFNFTLKYDKYNSNNKRKSDIFLENLKKYLQKQNKIREKKIFKQAIDTVKDIKKQEFIYRDLQNPEYKRFNIYRSRFYADYILPRSFTGLTVAQAWGALKDCWTGFKINYHNQNPDLMKHYAKGVQKYLYLLEEVPVDFSNIGLQPFKYFLEDI